ncbi:hypothetical protein G647_05384 [Cladophialophora carrionii CBS 160.54]|uniref:Uncharacterized protein n=1 Tax=Cladophialophora carrionii CBS 160.54 TaxID=1279043 RepID=V9DC85_9EURO|nr:uncharacterized protein G647_05384 [Cladophialophora carrionii CBS 160.54]ETI23582.1 hypothetical protein G647_05384 [Cladophialophora carrionii CBS 160.54]
MDIRARIPSCTLNDPPRTRQSVSRRRPINPRLNPIHGQRISTGEYPTLCRRIDRCVRWQPHQVRSRWRPLYSLDFLNKGRCQPTSLAPFPVSVYRRSIHPWLQRGSTIIITPLITLPHILRPKNGTFVRHATNPSQGRVLSKFIRIHIQVKSPTNASMKDVESTSA